MLNLLRLPGIPSAQPNVDQPQPLFPPISQSKKTEKCTNQSSADLLFHNQMKVKNNFGWFATMVFLRSPCSVARRNFHCLIESTIIAVEFGWQILARRLSRNLSHFQMLFLDDGRAALPA
ncbi:MAG TPA: hypothetical protein PLB97_01370 [Accumulibacter sp.]|jgi:hypothetical protein|nr:hypothetical protein [Accumulibacter sp.]HPP48016.1 hypothetical protein [Accumulibacter sp.]